MPLKKPATARSRKKQAGADVPTGSPEETSQSSGDASRSQSVTDLNGLERARILSKYWELANLDPEVTKGNITGQLKALDSLREEMGLLSATAQREEPPAQQIYRSAWMRPADENTDR